MIEVLRQKYKNKATFSAIIRNVIQTDSDIGWPLDWITQIVCQLLVKGSVLKIRIRS